MADAYAAAGVNYDRLDAFKRACQQAARGTVGALAGHGYAEPADTRGESAYLLEAADHFLAHVEEGLGTKNLIADAMGRLTGECYYHAVGIDTVATIVNDLITCGALPISVAMHAAVGDSEWFADEKRAADLAAGFAEGCRLAGAVWGGGETPTLRGIVEPDAIVLAGSAVGTIAPKSRRITGDAIAEGDAIVVLASSGVQTNGLTLCRKIGEALPESYLTRMSNGETYGAGLLARSIIYVDFVRACLERAVPLHYVAHVTGHGWRKLMRARGDFVYRMEALPPALPVFDFIARHAKLDAREMYGTFNMGAGFAAYVPAAAADEVVAIARELGHTALRAGTVLKQGGRRRAVEIVPAGVSFEAESLQLR